jgi:endonuclease/exonuclease/phosphatase family metal-dependent hydrolase
MSSILILLAWAWIAQPGAPLQASPGEGSRPALELSLISFNVRYDNPSDGPDAWAARREQVYALIRDRRPDAIGLQEVLKSQLDDLARAVPEYGAIGAGRDDGKEKGEYSPVLYLTSRFEAPESGTFWLSDTPEAPGSNTWNAACVRVCTWVRLTEKPTGRSFYLFNTHLDHQNQAARDRGAELIAARMAARAHPEDPVILAGDLNAGEENSTVMFLTGRAPRAYLAVSPAPPRTGLVDSFRVAHPDEADVGTFHAFKGPAGDTHRKIDYILVPQGTEVLETSIDRRHRDGRYPSDHYPVTARIGLK